jgi:hypothetical protein
MNVNLEFQGYQKTVAAIRLLAGSDENGQLVYGNSLACRTWDLIASDIDITDGVAPYYLVDKMFATLKPIVDATAQNYLADLKIMCLGSPMCNFVAGELGVIISEEFTSAMSPNHKLNEEKLLSLYSKMPILKDATPEQCDGLLLKSDFTKKEFVEELTRDFVTYNVPLNFAPCFEKIKFHMTSPELDALSKVITFSRFSKARELKDTTLDKILNEHCQEIKKYILA